MNIVDMCVAKFVYGRKAYCYEVICILDVVQG